VRLAHCSNLWRPLGFSRRPTNSSDNSKKEYEKSYVKPMRICIETDNNEISVSRGSGIQTRLREIAQSLSHEPVPAHYVAPKITFTGVEDPESHLTMFKVQIIISGGSDAVRCKMFMGTFTGTAIQWFSKLPDDHITTFTQFARLFRKQFYANRVKPQVLYDLFNVRQRKRRR